MVDKTLRKKQLRLAELAEIIKAAEVEKAKLSAEVMEEYAARGIDVWGLYRITERRTERVNKKDVPAAIWDRFKTVSTSRFLTKAKQA